MRDPARIPKLLAQLQAFWEKNPDLRLGQIIENLAAPGEDYVFYIEDEVLANRLPPVSVYSSSSSWGTQVRMWAGRLQRRLSEVHPDDLGDGMRRDIQELLRALDRLLGVPLTAETNPCAEVPLEKTP